MVHDEQHDMILKVLSYARRLAVVGLSPRSRRPSNQVASMLAMQGYDIVPVNPHVDTVVGERSYPTLQAVPGEIDAVVVFRHPKHLEEVAEDAVAAGARSLWNQLGLRSPEARRIAEDAGLDYVEDRCFKVEVGRYRRELTLPPTDASG